MKSVVNKFDAWHKTKVGYLVMGLLELAIAYIVGSRALDTASWWEYLFALILLIGAVQNLVKLGRLVVRHDR